MSNLSMFFAQNVVAAIEESVVVSDRFKDKDGKPVPWTIRSITEEENEACRKAATRKVKVNKVVGIPETNFEEYQARLAVASVVYPDLKDAELQKSYGILGAEKLLAKMLLPGEYATLQESVQRINGFDRDINELKDDVKN
ncbi:phage portal protein [Paenibacillus sp. GbtcB18]|uniref:phage tail assembly chaperone n=1 Tax=Paenibacillus sp. GbtcB18 TaxID=2824763 RepID=UPI001C2F3DAB|nr:phage portal protein [Paenibacillus sp. GbtcB18]